MPISRNPLWPVPLKIGLSSGVPIYVEAGRVAVSEAVPIRTASERQTGM